MRQGGETGRVQPAHQLVSFHVCLIHEKPALELNPAESLASAVLVNATVILVEC